MSRIPFVLVCVFLLAVACSSSSDGDREQTRGALKGEQLSGSCESRCGQPADRNNRCFCDSECTQYGDCCVDFTPLCNSCDAFAGRCKSSCTPNEDEHDEGSCVGDGHICCVVMPPTCEEVGGRCEGNGSCPPNSDPIDGTCPGDETCCKPMVVTPTCTGTHAVTGETMSGTCATESQDIPLTSAECPDGQFCGISFGATCAQLNGVCRHSCSRGEVSDTIFGPNAVDTNDCFNQGFEACCRPDYCQIEAGGTCTATVSPQNCVGEYIDRPGDGLCSLDGDASAAYACCVPSNKACEEPGEGPRRPGICKVPEECTGRDEIIRGALDENGVSPLCPETPGDICCTPRLVPLPPT